MRLMKNRKLMQLVLCVTATLAGCLGGQGSTDGGSGADGDFQDDIFVSDESTTGGMRLEIAESSIAVGDTSEFLVFVRDEQQQPVPNINVICDSEGGVAILEPSTGYALTNGRGAMSGVIGCEAPGSFQLVCRLSVGANRRQFASVRCTGDTPSDFEGFPGAGGGGLGGGSVKSAANEQAHEVDTGVVDEETVAPDADSLDADQRAECLVNDAGQFDESCTESQAE
jgi:hypothetical protein